MRGPMFVAFLVFLVCRTFSIFCFGRMFMAGLPVVMSAASFEWRMCKWVNILRGGVDLDAGIHWPRGACRILCGMLGFVVAEFVHRTQMQ